jgi:hypothetical protein
MDKLWRNAQRVSSDPSARAYGRRAEALAKEDMLPASVAKATSAVWARRVSPKILEGARLAMGLYV